MRLRSRALRITFFVLVAAVLSVGAVRAPDDRSTASAATFINWDSYLFNTSHTSANVAATAITNNLVVVTRNIRDFKPFDVPTLNPFRSER